VACSAPLRYTDAGIVIIIHMSADTRLRCVIYTRAADTTTASGVGWLASRTIEISVRALWRSNDDCATGSGAEKLASPGGGGVVLGKKQQHTRLLDSAQRVFTARRVTVTFRERPGYVPLVWFPLVRSRFSISSFVGPLSKRC
jgi:hypothetical protein